MADYPTLKLQPGAAPVQEPVAAEDVTWQVQRGAIRISTRSAITEPDEQGLVLRAGGTVEGASITAGKAVWYWPIGGDATVTREAL